MNNKAVLIAVSLLLCFHQAYGQKYANLNGQWEIASEPICQHNNKPMGDEYFNQNVSDYVFIINTKVTELETTIVIEGHPYTTRFTYSGAGSPNYYRADPVNRNHRDEIQSFYFKVEGDVLTAFFTDKVSPVLPNTNLCPIDKIIVKLERTSN